VQWSWVVSQPAILLRENRPHPSSVEQVSEANTAVLFFFFSLIEGGGGGKSLVAGERVVSLTKRLWIARPAAQSCPA
jgi:hypothetical protein